MTLLSDLRAGTAALAEHPASECRRAAALLARVLAGQQSPDDLALLIANDRVRQRDEELHRWRWACFAEQSDRRAADAMAREWRRYPTSDQARVDPGISLPPPSYLGTDREHLFALAQIGCDPLSSSRIRMILSSLRGLPTPLSVSQKTGDSLVQDEQEIKPHEADAGPAEGREPRAA